ncbi:MAG: right-handed parallel beta-helix repeat-containing protein, partial [Promethearchaeota archaeon]
MRKLKNKRFISICLVIYIISLYFNSFNIYFNDYFQNFDNTYQTIFIATNHLDLDGPLIIDGNDEWASIANSYSWCSGSGLKSDPYIIENLSINGKASGYCFEIKNSDVFFVIENCIIYNAGGNGTENAGITLRNVSNGNITNNTIKDNRNSGIYLYNCDYNTISYNSINKSHFSIYLSYSSYNNISNNIAFAWTEPDSNYIRDNQMRIRGSDYN